VACRAVAGVGIVGALVRSLAESLYRQERHTDSGKHQSYDFQEIPLDAAEV
jgi:hypothetical protein